MTVSRTLPDYLPEEAHFWTGGEHHLLQFLHCDTCNKYVHPPAPVCPECLTANLAVKAVSGRASIATFTINYQEWVAGLTEPYVVAIVEIEEQSELRLTTNIIDCKIEDVKIGMPVEVTFERHEDVYLPLFRPRGAD